MEIGPFIKFHRVKQKMTQEHLAEGIVSESYLSKIENQKTAASPEVIDMLCTRLNIQLENNNDTKIRERSQDWFDKLYRVNDMEKLKTQYEDLQHLISSSYSDIQVMFEIHKIRYFVIRNEAERALEQINYLREISSTFDALQQHYWMKFNGNYYSLIEDFDQAIRFYKLAEEKINHIDLSEEEVADLKYTLGVTYSKLCQTLAVIDYTKQALETFRRYYNFQRCSQAHILLGISYRRLRIYDEAIKNYNLANRLATLNNDESLVNLTNINLGHLYSTTGDSATAIELFNKVLAEKATLDDEKLFGTILDLIKEYERLQDYEKAAEETKKGLAVLQERDMKYTEMYYYELKTYEYFLEKNEKEFENLVIGKFIPFLQKQKDQVNLAVYCNLAGKHYESLNKYKKAVKYYKLVNAVYKDIVRI